MKICIVSDSHDHRPLLEAAVRAAKKQGAEAVLHCGDVVAPSTLSVLKPLGLPIHVIHGNNTGDLYMMARIANKAGNLVTFYGQDASLQLGGSSYLSIPYDDAFNVPFGATLHLGERYNARAMYDGERTHLLAGINVGRVTVTALWVWLEHAGLALSTGFGRAPP